MRELGPWSHSKPCNLLETEVLHVDHLFETCRHQTDVMKHTQLLHVTSEILRGWHTAAWRGKVLPRLKKARKKGTTSKRTRDRVRSKNLLRGRVLWNVHVEGADDNKDKERSSSLCGREFSRLPQRHGRLLRRTASPPWDRASNVVSDELRTL